GGGIAPVVDTGGVDLVTFEKGQRKDDVAQQYLASFTGEEGVLFVGKAQEKASVFRTEKRRDAQGKTYPWIIRSTAMVNHYYVYILDKDFGPLFIKFCSYFPYPAKLCLNGHEWLKRQLTQREVPLEPLDKGILASAPPHAWALSHARADRGRRALTPCRVQEVQGQAVPQRRAGPSHRDHH